MAPLMDNPAPAAPAENVATQEQAAPVTQTSGFVQTPAQQTFSWKTQLGPDIANSPTIQKFQDTKEGLAEATKSHLELEKLLGNEKVPIPKGPDDKEGWARFEKAFNIPAKAEGYALPDVQIPESMKALTFDKGKFQETIHKYKLTPDQAKGVWGEYTNMTKEIYGKALKDHQDHMTGIVNTMRGEWGDAYESNVELGQMVINKFSENQEMNDYLTSTLSKDPRGIKFLAKVGNQFSENKIGDFSSKRFALTPDQAQEEINAIRNDPKHPYMDPKATQAEHDRAVKYVDSLYQIVAKKPRG